MTYKLDLINRKILYELDKNCRISDNQLAKKVNLSRESIRNRIKKLQKEGIIQGFITSINPSKFGYMFFKLYFQLANNPKERERFYEYFKKIPGLYWFGGNDGVWDFHSTIYARNVKEFNDLKNKIYTEFRGLIIKRDVGILVNVRQYTKRYLHEKFKEISEPAIFADDIIDNKLDELDQKILNNLAQNARIGLVELSKKIKSTVDIVRNRIRKMEEKKIILQYRIAVDHTKLGYDMFKAFIYFNNLSEQDEKRLFEYAKQNNKILYLIRQLSAWDIELEIMAESYEEFSSLMDEIRLKFVDSLRNYEFVLMREDIWVFGEKDIF
ncbi:Lrp/AsnC family transcriptional regulator [Candidatus Woesearchaeota archaeon]|nr:Lrp/AsnC family transcriptional regulator [Candidatus Woesearchaeota archaeon]